ncbi:MAG: alcohol dehydrogenase catalytic domain-containing protein [Fimbriimonadaceae bacterium]|nr:alcohol dehydrogenase catalytic domain-containing protein [Fimbriimonadaceae bacterium]
MIPNTQHAVQLAGPGELRLTDSKPVFDPGPHQFLVRVEAVGLCFSDLKLLKQFAGHARKAPVTEGLPAEVLAEMPQYVPGEQPTVPGHEVVCRVVKTGPSVRHHRVGDRLIVQADYRTLKTAGSNSAFGYNFEGGLQEYVLFDERVVGNPESEHGYLIPVPENLGASSLALVEPWACVENSYVTAERETILPRGRRLIVGRDADDIARLAGDWESGTLLLRLPGQPIPPDDVYDDIVCSVPDPVLIADLAGRLGKGGLLSLVLDGARLNAPVPVDIGRVHYSAIRLVGTFTHDLADALAMLPPTGEIRDGDRVLVIGAGGPMGQMHVIRTLLGFPHAHVVATDTSRARLDELDRKVAPLVSGHRAAYRSALATELATDETFDYIAIMAPVPALVHEAVHRSRQGARINLFAGIPPGTVVPLDLQTILERRVFLFGTSGSEPRDMRLVLAKVMDGRLRTDLSVAAVSGMAGSIDGLRAVEDRSLDGKIVVYPSLLDLPLTPLSELRDRLPQVAALLRDGSWTQEAESELLRVASQGAQ